jgi:bacterioferritin (cytochrome b1)
MATQAHHNESDIKYLNSFLKNELAAMETYKQVIGKADTADLSSSLSSLQESHKRRADMLAERIRSLGGKPADSAGAWGGIAKMVQAGSNLFGEKAAIHNLEEGEDRGRDDYQRDVSKLSPENQRFIEERIMPEQLRSHDAMEAIEQQVRRLH